MIVTIQSDHERAIERLKAIRPQLMKRVSIGAGRSVLDARTWEVARRTAKRIGGRKKNDPNFILSIYKRLGGRIANKSNGGKMVEHKTGDYKEGKKGYKTGDHDMSHDNDMMEKTGHGMMDKKDHMGTEYPGDEKKKGIHDVDLDGKLEKELRMKEHEDDEEEKKEDINMLALVPFHAVANQKRQHEEMKRQHDEEVAQVGKEEELQRKNKQIGGY